MADNEHLTPEQRKPAEAAAREEEKKRKQEKRRRGSGLAKGADPDPWGFDIPRSERT